VKRRGSTPAHHISVCCVAKRDNGIRCVRVCVCACIRVCGHVWRGSRFCVRRMCEGVSRVLCGGVVRSGWASATLRWTARAFNPRATRSASAPPPSFFYTPIGRAHAHTGRGHPTTGKKIGNNNNKIIRRFSPSSVVFVRVSFLYTFFLFFLSSYFDPVPLTCHK